MQRERETEIIRPFKKNKILPFATRIKLEDTILKLEDTILSKTSQTGKRAGIISSLYGI